MTPLNFYVHPTGLYAPRGCGCREGPGGPTWTAGLQVTIKQFFATIKQYRLGCPQNDYKHFSRGGTNSGFEWRRRTDQRTAPASFSPFPSRSPPGLQRCMWMHRYCTVNGQCSRLLYTVSYLMHHLPHCP